MIGESGYMARHDDIVDAVAQIEIERGRRVREASNRFATPRFDFGTAKLMREQMAAVRASEIAAAIPSHGSARGDERPCLVSPLTSDREV